MPTTVAQINSDLAYTNAQALLSAFFSGAFPQVDLFLTASSPYDTLSDFVLASFPGYHSVTLTTPGIIIPDASNSYETLDMNAAFFQASAAPSSAQNVAGFVVSDGSGNVYCFNGWSSGHDWIVSTALQFANLVLSFWFGYTVP